jgi:hypothetical protein
MKRVLILFVIIVFLYGCAYTVPDTISPAVNIYSSYDDKIKGPVVLVIDNNLKTINQRVTPSSYLCSEHSYPVVMESALASSIKSTTDAIFDQVIEKTTLPTQQEMQKSGIQGSIYVRLNRFYPTIGFLSGFWEPHGMASCDIVLDVTVKDAENKNLLVTTVGGARTADGGGGAYCGNGANILSNAISLSIRETMERYAERISNSDKIRRPSRKEESIPSNLTTPQATPPKKPISSSPIAPSPGTAKIVTVTWTFANIRSGAGDEFPIVTHVKQGDKLTLLGEYGEWFNVRLENGEQGWISNRVVK